MTEPTYDPTTMPKPDLLSAGELAEALGVTSATVRRWCRKQQLKPTTITFGGYYRFDLEEAREQLDRLRHVRNAGINTRAEAVRRRQEEEE